jgi:hypothetical protein
MYSILVLRKSKFYLFPMQVVAHSFRHSQRYALNNFLVGQNNSCRFKLGDSSEILKLTEVFALIISSLLSREIRWHSVSETTLEHDLRVSRMRRRTSYFGVLTTRQDISDVGAFVGTERHIRTAHSTCSPNNSLLATVESQQHIHTKALVGHVHDSC